MFGPSRLLSLVLAFCLGFSVCLGALSFGAMALVANFRVRDLEKHGIDLPDELFMKEDPEVDLLNLSIVEFFNEIKNVQSLGDEATLNYIQDRYGLLIHEKIDAVLTDEAREMPLSKLFSKEGFSEIVGRIYVGNIENYVCYNADGTEGGDPKDDTSYWMTSDGTKITGIEDIIADFSFNDFISGNINTNTLFNEILIGDILGYTQVGDDWIDKEGNKVTGVIGAFAGSTIHSVGSDINTLKIGSLMGYEEGEDGVWYKTNEETGEKEKVSGVIGAFADSTLNDVGNTMETAKVGELLGYTQKDDGKWYTTNEESGEEERVTGVMGVFADCSINDVGSKMETAMLGDLLGYVHKDDGKWYTTNDESGEEEKVTGVLSVFADCTINGVGDKIESAKLGELLGYELVDDQWCKDDGTGNMVKVSGAMAVFADSNINGIGDEIEKTQVGKLLGYELDGGVWYKADEVDADGNKIPVDGFMSKISNSTINNMDGVFETLVIGDVVKAEDRQTGIFSIIPADTKIDEIGSAVNDSIMDSPLQFFINNGLVTFSTTDGVDMSDTLDNLSIIKNDYIIIYESAENFKTQEGYYKDIWTPSIDSNGVACYKVAGWRTQPLSGSFAYIISLLTSGI